MLTIPGLCWLCQMPLALPHWGLCSCCCRHVLRQPPVCCPQCGLPAALAGVPCGRCLKKAPHWQYMVLVADYVRPLSTLLHSFKFRRQTALTPALARLLLLRIRDSYRTRGLPHPRCVFSVPLHKRRQWWRGYNHSALLAQWLAGKMDCVYQPAGIKRLRHTRIQHQLDAPSRRRNVKNAFQLTVAVSGLHVALVDDVVTTGSTVAEISRLLMRAGAASVQIWCLCRTLSQPDDQRMITGRMS